MSYQDSRRSSCRGDWVLVDSDMFSDIEGYSEDRYRQFNEQNISSGQAAHDSRNSTPYTTLASQLSQMVLGPPAGASYEAALKSDSETWRSECTVREPTGGLPQTGCPEPTDTPQTPLPIGTLELLRTWYDYRTTCAGTIADWNGTAGPSYARAQLAHTSVAGGTSVATQVSNDDYQSETYLYIGGSSSGSGSGSSVAPTVVSGHGTDVVCDVGLWAEEDLQKMQQCLGREPRRMSINLEDF